MWCYVKVTQINYFSRNKLHSAANLNFGSICKKAKHCWALSSVQLLVFLDHARSWIGAKIQISSKLLYGKVIPWNRITGIYLYVVLVCMYWNCTFKCLFYSTDPTINSETTNTDFSTYVSDYSWQNKNKQTWVTKSRIDRFGIGWWIRWAR